MNARRLLQYAGIGASTMIGLSGIIDVQISLGRSLINIASISQALLLAGFAVAFWYNTKEEKHRWLAISLLVLQTSVQLVGLPGDLLFLVAVEIPFIVRGRKAFFWLAGLDVLIGGLSLFAGYTGDFAISETVAHLGRGPGMVLTEAMMLSWTLVAFSAGYLILELEESRKATIWAKAQVEASQCLLAEVTRFGERLRISRELHDTIGHHLTGLAVNLELASELSSDASLKPIHRAQLITKTLLAETRDVVHCLRQNQSLDLKTAIEKLMTAVKHPACHLEISPKLRVGPAAARALFRCVQEAVTNCIRHAEAKNLWLKIIWQEERILLEASDDGQGTAQIIAGCGLRGMRERLTEIGGALEVESAPSRGFRLRGWIPANRD